MPLLILQRSAYLTTEFTHLDQILQPGPRQRGRHWRCAAVCPNLVTKQDFWLSICESHLSEEVECKYFCTLWENTNSPVSGSIFFFWVYPFLFHLEMVFPCPAAAVVWKQTTGWLSVFYWHKNKQECKVDSLRWGPCGTVKELKASDS